MPDDAVRDEVWKTVCDLNDAWTKEKGDRLQSFFHPRMVAITPADRLRRKGAAECIAGWQGFAQAATIHSWKTENPDIEIFGDTAVVTYYYEMDVTLGVRQTLAGRDMLILHREQGKWWLVADQFSPYPG
jgi:ketosteroid isomerase-like protein